MERHGGKAERTWRTLTFANGVAIEADPSSNYVVTGKFTLWNYLPKNFAEQIVKPSTLWFLFVALVLINPLQFAYTASYEPLILLLIHLCLAVAKDSLSVYRTHRSDQRLNNELFQVWTGEGFTSKKCRDIAVGDVLLLGAGQRVPADLILLATSAAMGVCYLSTASVIGESSLVAKTAVRETQEFLKSADDPPTFDFNRLNGSMKFEQPSAVFSAFSGSLKLQYILRAIPLRLEQLLFRGASVKGAEWTLGIVVYAGMETKIWSSRSRAVKRPSTFARLLSNWTLIASSSVLCVSALQVLIQSQYSQTTATGATFLEFIVLYSSLVPIALLIVLDLLRIAHVVRLSRDKNPKFAVTVNSGELTEDLGKVNYLLADKTGTLTENELELVAVVVRDQAYTKLQPQRQRRTREGSVDTFLFSDSKIDPPLATVEYDYREGCTFEDLKEAMQTGKDEDYQRFVECLLLCNTVVPLINGEHLATSIDEEALIQGCEEMGCRLLSRSPDSCQVEIFDSCFSYQLIGLRKFTPEMRRMRILVEREGEDFATLYIKGAYAVLKDMLAMTETERERVEAEVERFGRRGLRTMVMGFRRLRGDYLSEIKGRIVAAKVAKVNFDGKVEVLFKELERELKFLAITGIRDKILPETKECIDLLRRAGLETWIVSGDSESNTLACAYSLGLIGMNSDLVSLRGIESNEVCARRLLQVVNQFIFHNEPMETDREELADSLHLSSLLKNRFIPESVDLSISLDSITLDTALAESDSRRLLTCVLFASSFACFNCMHPNHKRKIVKLLREGLTTSPIVLAVGDGNNDVPMLMEADIGVAILNKEGNRAASSSDLTINCFSSLAELMLKNGKRNSILLGQTVLLYLRAQGLILSITFVFSMLADYSPSGPLPYSRNMLLNLVFTSIPILYIGVCNNRLSDRSCFKYPNTYNKSSYANLSWKSIRIYMLLTAFQVALVAAVLFSGLLCVPTVSNDEVAVVVTIALTLSINQQCLYEVRRVTIPLVVAEFIGVGAMLCYFAVDDDLRPALGAALSQASLALSALGAPLSASIASLIFAYYSSRKDALVFNPSRARVWPEMMKSSFIERARGVSGALLRVYRQRATFSAKKTHSNYDLSRRSARFKSPNTEKTFILDFLAYKLPLLKLLFLVMLLQLLTFIAHLSVRDSHNAVSFSAVIIAFSAGVLLLFLFWIGYTALTATTVFALILVVGTALVDFIEDSVSGIVYFLAVTELMLLMREYWARNCAVAVIACALLTFVAGINTSVQSPETSEQYILDAVGNVIPVFLTTCICAFVSWQAALRERQEFALIKQSREKITQSDSILRCLLPEFVRKRVRDGIRYIAEDQGSVSVIFIEICDFDEICVRYSPSELIALLHDIFQKIDGICESVRVAKIETVGKVYMACAGLKDFELELAEEAQGIPHARRAVELAFAVLTSIKGYHLLTGKTLQMKIGVHTGQVIAGVVGFHKPQFSLVGDTVNTASRVCTTIDTPNTVQISEATSLALDSLTPFDMSKRVVQAKGKGDLNLYLVRELSEPTFERSRQRTNSTESPYNPRNGRRQSSVARQSVRNSLDLGSLYSKEDTGLVEKVSLFHCALHDLESEFRQECLTRDKASISLGVTAYLLGIAAYFAWRLQSYIQHTSGGIVLVPVLLFLLLSLNFALLLTTKRLIIKYHWYLPRVLVSVYICTGLVLTFDGEFGAEFPPAATGLILASLLMLIYYCSGGLFTHSVVSSAVLLPPWFALQIYQERRVVEPIVLALFAVQHGMSLYQEEKSQRSYFNQSKLAKREFEKTERLVTHMMPLHAYEGLKREQWSNDRLANVTLLYADISGFTYWSSKHTPQEVIDKLSKIFTAFDNICVQKGVYKVHTIGDCYVAMGATGNSEQRDFKGESIRMVQFALEMVKIVQRICAEDNDNLNMRIGLHVGEVVAGISGTHIVRYDIYGQDVLVANKMESGGREGRVNVSSALKFLLESTAPGRFSFEFNKAVEVRPGDPLVDSFFVADSQDSA